MVRVHGTELLGEWLATAISAQTCRLPLCFLECVTWLHVLSAALFNLPYPAIPTRNSSVDKFDTLWWRLSTVIVSNLFSIQGISICFYSEVTLDQDDSQYLTRQLQLWCCLRALCL